MNFCTFFDSNYINKGLSCYDSLIKYSPDSILYVLSLDEIVYKTVFPLKNVIIITIQELENYYPFVCKAKQDRNLKEYYLTLKPLLPLFVFDKYSSDLLFYVDSDMFFWSDPEEIINIMGNNSIMASDHNLVPVYPAGRFNAGFLGYRNDKNCRSFLEWWRDRCIEWCKWKTISPGKCGDQGYLNILYDSDLFSGFISCPHPGINLGPWKIAKHTITENNGKLQVDGKFNLICYHFHEFKLIDKFRYHSTGWIHSNMVDKLLYDVYFESVKKFI